MTPEARKTGCDVNNACLPSLKNQKGQATLEYALTGLILLAVIIGFATLQARLGEGLFIEHALNSASHGTYQDTGGIVGDVLLY